LILALVRQRQIYSEFEASLVYRVSSRTARATERNPVSKTQNTKQNNPPHTEQNKQTNKQTNKQIKTKYPKTRFKSWEEPSLGRRLLRSGSSGWS